MNTPAQSCATCAFSDIDHDEDGEPLMECRRFPPVIVADGDGLEGIAFPGVGVDLWCGEWEARTQG